MKRKVQKILIDIKYLLLLSMLYVASSVLYIRNKIKRIKGVPGKYIKDKSVGAYKVHINKNGQRNCKEIVRATINAQGDVYVFNNLEHQNKHPFHESFHKSGEYHWKDGSEYLYPAFNGNGLPASEKFINFGINIMPCFCLRKGKRLKEKEIRILVEKIKRYMPTFDTEIAVMELKNNQVCKFRNNHFMKDIKKRHDILNGFYE